MDPYDGRKYPWKKRMAGADFFVYIPFLQNMSSYATDMHSNIVLPGMDTPLVTSAHTIGPTCSKCGTVKKSGRRSCCGRGGAWFQKCGNAGDKTVNHTWAEGIRACESKF